MCASAIGSSSCLRLFGSDICRSALQSLANEPLAAFRHEVEQQAYFRILQLLVRINRGKLNRRRRRLFEYDPQAPLAQIGFNLETRLVDDAPAAERPFRQYISVVAVIRTAKLEFLRT